MKTTRKKEIKFNDPVKGNVAVSELSIVTDRFALSKAIIPTKVESDQEENLENILYDKLLEEKGVGLAANQLGLGVRACIINVKEPILLINPRFIEKSEEQVFYAEQCLSVPSSMKKPVKTIRHRTVGVMTDNLGEIWFTSDLNKDEQWETIEDFYNDEGMLECVTVQHEIDHLDGITIRDNTRRMFVPRRVENKYGRNEKVMIKFKDDTTKYLKYKFAQKYIKEEEAEII